MVYGTVDSLELKSLYLNIQTWVEPKVEEENWNRVVLNMSRNIKHTVLQTLDKKLFKESFIVDVDLRSSGISLGKKSFMNVEINLYLTEPLDFKSKTIKTSLKSIVKGIQSNILTKNNFFKFSFCFIYYLFCVIFIVFFWRYATIIEKNLFKKRIPSSKLKAGDVLENMNWVGLTEEQVKQLKKQKMIT